jgi:hypothetical protein
MAVSNPNWKTPSHGVFENGRSVEARDYGSFPMTDPTGHFIEVLTFGNHFDPLACFQDLL